MNNRPIDPPAISGLNLYHPPSSTSPAIDTLVKQNWNGGIAPKNSTPEEALKASPTKNPINPTTLKP